MLFGRTFHRCRPGQFVELTVESILELYAWSKSFIMMMEAISLSLHFGFVQNLESFLFAEPYGVALHEWQKRVDNHSFEEILTQLLEVFLFRDEFTVWIDSRCNLFYPRLRNA